MAKARYDRISGRKAPWEKARDQAMREAAADLLALAEIKPRSNLIAAGLSADAECKNRKAGLAAAFRAMLRQIAAGAPE
jgi:hypothetical protein